MELVGRLDQLHQANVDIVKAKIEQIMNQKDQADTLAKAVVSLLKRDELTVLDEYAKLTTDLKPKLEKLKLGGMEEEKVEGLKTINQEQLREFTGEIVDLVSKLDIRWI